MPCWAMTRGNGLSPRFGMASTPRPRRLPYRLIVTQWAVKCSFSAKGSTSGAMSASGAPQSPTASSHRRRLGCTDAS